MRHSVKAIKWLLLLVIALWGGAGEANYFRQPESNVDPKIFHIDDQKFLGNRLDPNLELLDEDDKSFRFKGFLGTPTILVFSYYTCDGSCSAVNSVLKEMVQEVKQSKIGEDFRILTISFDPNDTKESVKKFAAELDVPEELKDGWTLARLKDPGQLEAVTKQFGFKYFWSAQDKTFFHPNVYIFLSPDGRAARYLYALNNDELDMDLAILEARQGKFRPSQVIQLAVSLCYSYNYEEGRYTYNIPLFVGVGAFLTGIFTFAGFMIYYRRKAKKRSVQG
ncbi:MAG: SCO family protein [Magnetococcales bacterium]|nr:SCO family protein [Magnetococcales bacterium]